MAWELGLMDLGKGRRVTWRRHLTELDPDELPALRRTAVEREPVSPPKGARMYGMAEMSRHGVTEGEPETVTARIGAIHTVALLWREDPPGSRSFVPCRGICGCTPSTALKPGSSVRKRPPARESARQAG